MTGRRSKLTGNYARPDTGAPSLMPLDQLAQNPRNRRDEHQDAADELVESIRTDGILQPLGVVAVSAFVAAWPDHEAALDGARWVVVAGNRRLAAARLAGLATVPVHEVRLADAGAVDVLQLVENANRKALNPVAEAELVAALVDELGSRSAAGRRLGRTPAWVTQRLHLLGLAPEVRTALIDGTVRVADVRDWHQRDTDGQRQALTALKDGGQPDGAGNGRAPSGKSTRAPSARLHPGLPKATSNAKKALRELVLAVGDARHDGTSADELRAALEDVADGLGVDVDGLPPAVLAAAMLDRDSPSTNGR